MPTRLVRLIYVSRMTENCGMEELQAILKVAREKNTRLEITGALCYDPSFFLQCLEGPRARVNRLYSEIQQDTRHKDVTLLEYTEAAERIFADWSMAFLRTSDIEKNILQQFTGSGKFDPYTLSGKQARQFLTLIVRHSRESAAGS
jgi:hypothetical protein